jgi:signal transduction histidine kinase
LSEELEQRVIERTRQLAATNEELRTEIIERKRVEEQNRKLLHELTERVKEVTALHGAMRILQQGGADTPTGLRKLVSLLPSAFQYPEIAAARIRLGQIEAATPGFADSPATLRSEFTTGNKQPGSIEVVYAEDRPPAAEGPFLAEERAFLNTLADMVRTFYDRQQAEKQLRASGEQLRALSQNLNSAREEEGMRIARELHDELGSALTSLKWDLESIDKLCSDAHDKFDFSSLREKVKGMVEIVDSTINSVRRISSELRPGILDDLGLVAALEWQAQQFEARAGIDCRFDSLLENIDLGREQATAIFRIFQEALTNILRHAQATRVSVLIEEEEGEIVLKVEDNGRGITEEEKTGPRSLGLIGMRERAHLAGGRLEIMGIAGKGTTLMLRVPLNSLSSNNQP